MKNLLLVLLLANILYLTWGFVVDEPPEAGVAIVNESELGPPFEITDNRVAKSAGARPGSGRPSKFTAVVGRSCVSIGPFANSADAEQVSQDYETAGMAADVRSAGGQLFVGNWVQIQNIRDRDMANAMLKKLVAGGLADAYMLDSDDEGLKISLGLFDDVARAEKVELQAESLNLPADITRRMRDARVFYVDIALPPGRGASAMIGKYGEDKVLLRTAATCPKSG